MSPADASPAAVRTAADVGDAAILKAEVPNIDGWWFHAERCECGADLAPMIGPVMQGLCEPDPDRGVGLGSVVMTTHDNGVRINELSQEPGPGHAVAFHHGPQLWKAHVILVDARGALPLVANRYQESAPTRWPLRVED